MVNGNGLTGEKNWEIVISGVGGQGVLFLTRLMAEAAVQKGFRVFTSETHGMAQRGGTVLSHLKVGDFKSPLIRPGKADGIFSLTGETLIQHAGFVKDGGFAIVNTPAAVSDVSLKPDILDAAAIAERIENPKAVNLIVLGFGLAALSDFGFFCNPDDISSILDEKLSGRTPMLEASKRALAAGGDAR